MHRHEHTIYMHTYMQYDEPRKTTYKHTTDIHTA